MGHNRREREDVAPRVGAWIETRKEITSEDHSMSHPVWVRGLKLVGLRDKPKGERSHPVWVRGLKRETFADMIYNNVSHPVWVRGLKPEIIIDVIKDVGVAPRVGAWIET